MCVRTPIHLSQINKLSRSTGGFFSMHTICLTLMNVHARVLNSEESSLLIGSGRQRTRPKHDQGPSQTATWQAYLDFLNWHKSNGWFLSRFFCELTYGIRYLQNYIALLALIRRLSSVKFQRNSLQIYFYWVVYGQIYATLKQVR